MSLLSNFLRDLIAPDVRPPNAFMWRGEATPFYNRWWLKANAEDGDAYSIQIVVNNPWDTEKTLENTCVHIFFDRFSAEPEKNLMTMTDWPLDSLEASRDGLKVTIAGNEFSERRFVGRLEDHHHDKTIEFDLAIEADSGFLLSETGLDGLSGSRIANTLWQAPMARCTVSGTIQIDAEKIKLSRAPGYQDTFWGSSVPDRWFWAQCNSFVEDPSASLVVAGGQLEFLEAKFPRFLDVESFPLLIGFERAGRRVFFNSILHRTDYSFDQGRVRIDTRRKLGGIRLIYSSDVKPAALRAMDWHSPDDTVLASKMTLTAPATLEVQRRRGGRWELERTLTTPNAASICGGAKMDRSSRRHPLIQTLVRSSGLLAYVAWFYLRGLLGLGKSKSPHA